MTNLYNPTYLHQIETAADTLCEKLTKLQASGKVPLDTEINLARTKDGETDEDVIGYYLASMSKQSVFWFEKVRTSMVTGYERAVVSKSHLGKLLFMPSGNTL